jgi:putative hemolysin
MPGSIILLLVLIIFNALFAASEIAIISVNRNKIEEMANNGHKKAKQVQRFISRPTRFLSTIQSGITFVGFFASASASQAFAEDLGNILAKLPLITPDVGKTLAIIIVTVLLSYVTIVFGELVPKRLAMKKPEAIAFRLVGMLRIIATILRPFVWFLTISTNLMIRILGIDPNQEDNPITEEEIRTMVAVGGDRGVIDESEKEMINNIFEFDDTEVSEIMTHRTEIIGIPIDANIDEVVNLVFNEKYTRFPVYENNIDNIIGILHVKDLLRYKEKYVEGNFSIKDIIRTAYYVPDSKKN